MPNVYKTVDNQNFVSTGNAPDQIKQLIWQGLPGKYIAVTAVGLLTTIDYGATWGYVYPNTEFATTLPGGAVGYQTAFAIGPRGGNNCNPATGDLIAAGARFDDETFDFIGTVYAKSSSSWPKVSEVGEPGTYPWELIISPNNLLVLNEGGSVPGILPIYVSTDLGRTWITRTAPGDLYGIKFDSVGNIWSWGAVTPMVVYKSEDNGITFTVKKTLAGFGQVGLPVPHPTDPLKICMPHGYPQSPPSNFTISTSVDGGDNWTDVIIGVGGGSEGQQSRGSGVWLTSGRIVVFYAVTGPSSPGELKTVFSDDNGVTWSAPVTVATIGASSVSIESKAHEINGTVVVTLESGATANSENTFRSLDEGVTWTDISVPAGYSGVYSHTPNVVDQNNTLYAIVELGAGGFELWYLTNADVNTTWVKDSTYPESSITEDIFLVGVFT